jgi:hypothetical protein
MVVTRNKETTSATSTTTGAKGKRAGVLLATTDMMETLATWPLIPPLTGQKKEVQFELSGMLGPKCWPKMIFIVSKLKKSRNTLFLTT